MEDFRNFSKNNHSNSSNADIFEMVKNLSNKFDGKSTGDLLKAIYYEAEKGKRAGTLSNADIDNFSYMISPFLDERQKKYLTKIVNELKKI